MNQSPVMQGKRITIYVNGDPHKKGKTLTLNHRQMPAFDSFCSFLTERVPNTTGVRYRHVYTPNGTEVRALDQIEAGNEYVASHKTFTRIGYKDIQEKTLANRSSRKKIETVTYTPVTHAVEEKYRNKKGRSKSLSEQNRGLRLRVHINNENEKPVFPITIQSTCKSKMTGILNTIEDALRIPPIERVFKIQNQGYGGPADFTEIHEVEELNFEDHILVVPKRSGHVVKTVYLFGGKQDFKVTTSPRHGLQLFDSLVSNDKNHKPQKSLNRNKVIPSIGSSKQSDSRSPFSNAGSQAGRRNNQKSRTRQVDYDKDNGGVFRAKKQNNARGAQQERMNEDDGMHQNDEFDDESFNRSGFDRNTPGGPSKDMRSSTPASRGESRPAPASRGESRQRQLQKENEAAAKIQAGARGYKARKEFNAKKESMQRDKDERNQHKQEDDMRRQEEEDERRRQADAQQSNQKKAVDEDLAASKIQASFKGYKTRKEMDVKKKQQGQK